jgi:hypothetical protein
MYHLSNFPKILCTLCIRIPLILFNGIDFVAESGYLNAPKTIDVPEVGL